MPRRVIVAITLVATLGGCAAGVQYSHLEQRDRELTQMVLDLQNEIDELSGEQEQTQRSLQRLQRDTESEIAGIRDKTDHFDVHRDGSSFMLVPAD